MIFHIKDSKILPTSNTYDFRLQHIDIFFNNMIPQQQHIVPTNHYVNVYITDCLQWNR